MMRKIILYLIVGALHFGAIHLLSFVLNQDLTETTAFYLVGVATVLQVDQWDTKPNHRKEK